MGVDAKQMMSDQQQPMMGPGGRRHPVGDPVGGQFPRQGGGFGMGGGSVPLGNPQWNQGGIGQPVPPQQGGGFGQPIPPQFGQPQPPMGAGGIGQPMPPRMGQQFQPSGGQGNMPMNIRQLMGFA